MCHLPRFKKKMEWTLFKYKLTSFSSSQMHAFISVDDGIKLKINKPLS